MKATNCTQHQGSPDLRYNAPVPSWPGLIWLEHQIDCRLRPRIRRFFGRK